MRSGDGQKCMFSQHLCLESLLPRVCFLSIFKNFVLFSYPSILDLIQVKRLLIYWLKTYALLFKCDEQEDRQNTCLVKQAYIRSRDVFQYQFLLYFKCCRSGYSPISSYWMRISDKVKCLFGSKPNIYILIHLESSALWY